MIVRCDHLPSVSDPTAACRMHTLWHCYGEFPNLLSVFCSDDGGVLCRFENRLLITGNINPTELKAFADALGICEIQGTAVQTTHMPGFETQTRRVLAADTALGSALLPDSSLSFDLRSVFELLCACDDDFKAKSDYLTWLSDMRRRMRLAGAVVLFDARGATASIISVGGGYALIGSVAVLPQARGHGLAKVLLEALCKHVNASGHRPLAVAQTTELEAFYHRLGFSDLCEQITLTRLTDEGIKKHDDAILV